MKTAGGALQDEREIKKPRISSSSDPVNNNGSEHKTFEILCGNVSALLKAMEDEEPVSLKTSENGDILNVDTLGLPKTISAFFDKETQLYPQSQQIVIKHDKSVDPHCSKDLDALGAKTRIEITNIDNYSTKVALLLAHFDTVWKGEGGSEAGLLACPPGQIIPARRSTCHQLIIQVDGEQFVKFSTVGYEYEETDGILHEPATLDHVGQKVGLKPGDVQYVPPFFVKESTVVGSTPSLSLHIYFAAKIQWDDLLERTLQKAEDELSATNKGELSDNPLSQVQFVFQKALELCPSIFQTTSIRNLSRHQFRVSHSVNLIEALEKNSGFIKIDNFLPISVAESIYSSLMAVKEGEWRGQIDEDDDTHEFLSSSVFPNSRAIFEIFQNICPGKQSHFSAAKYLEGHFMSEHDDTESSHVAEGNIYSRTIAIVYHVSKNWKEEYGGVFVDAASDPPKKYVPEFNSLVAFQVPRRHFVEAVKNHGPRYSIYGWFHEFDRECSHEEISISDDSGLSQEDSD